MRSVTVARVAMGSVFEIVACGEDETYLRAAAEEALAEVARLDDQMSLYNPSSELCRINRRAHREAVRVEPRLYALLVRAKEIHELTGGAFDIAVQPLVDAWGFFGEGRRPGRRELAQARAVSGMHLVTLRDGTIRFAREGVALDLGGIGKGYALDRAAEILRARGITRAFLHGGTSSMLALDEWPVGIVDPRDPERRLGTVVLRDRALSASSAFGKFFTERGRAYGHILDPRTGRPVEGVAGAWALADSAADSDAFATAFHVLGRVVHVDGAVLTKSRVICCGIDLRPSARGPVVSRRSFLKVSAAAAAAFSVGLPKSTPAQDKPVPRELKVAVVGLGEQGRQLLAQLVRLPAVKVVAIADLLKAQTQAAMQITGRNVEVYDTGRELIESEEVDAVIVATPPHTHAELVTAALAAGRHVFVEAPLANSIDDCKRIARAARDAKKICQVGHQRRTSKLYPHALNHIRAGAVGTITHFRGQWQRKTSWRRAAAGNEEKLLNWRLYRETSGGLLLEYGVHHIDVVNWYLGAEPVSVTGFGSLTKWKDGREVEDNVQVVFEYPNGVLVQWAGSLTSSYNEEVEVVMGDAGAILLQNQRKGLLFREADATRQGWEVYAKKEMLGGERGIILDAEATKYKKQMEEELGEDAGRADFYAELEQFAECVRQGREPACDAAAGLKAAVACIVAGEAVRTRSVIRFDKSMFEV